MAKPARNCAHLRTETNAYADAAPRGSPRIPRNSRRLAFLEIATASFPQREPLAAGTDSSCSHPNVTVFRNTRAYARESKVSREWLANCDSLRACAANRLAALAVAGACACERGEPKAEFAWRRV
jgi:hypothetical protein